ncbi:MAG: S-methyl-5'-thioadenosine phosphorylase [Limnochordia bacterium]
MLAIIGGTGVYDPAFLTESQERTVKTPYGDVPVLVGQGPRGPVAFLARHGRQHGIPPHKINYRANIWALKELGVQGIIATAAVGSLRRDLPPRTFVLLDQFIDFTKSRCTTFYDGAGGKVVHTDFTEPYCPRLRQYLQGAAKEVGIELRPTGCYVTTEGPRFETPAEVAMFGRLGGDVVGMTGVPEVVLAREVGICYATVAMVTNYGAGLSQQPLTHEEVDETMNQLRGQLRNLLSASLESVPGEEKACCGGEMI